MAVSGGCAAVVGLLYAGPPLLLTVVVLLWGLTIVADSAQFSAGVAELSEPDGVGTMLTLQTSVGFLLTLATIHLVPWFAEQARSEEHTSELQSLMRISSAVFCLK